ncbi:CACTA en-spm transposon protein [Cucumis melo var. makuwa]|uniref:CACTA en-spm transposon protein n=1 Tax=Cucumis melo var. makuwa TaxID=1194695 RepID=A0A5D3E005_CUCMM|nr:CACTA en-spm transposon protein [Cucumis melo var. makuwa]
MSTGTMYNFSDFDESDDLFDFNAEEFNIVPGTSSIGYTSDASQPSAPIPRKRQHFRYLELDRYVVQNGKIPTSIAPSQDKPILANVTLENIELVKGGLQEFKGQNDHHFKTFDDPEQARANLPSRLSNRVKD